MNKLLYNNIEQYDSVERWNAGAGMESIRPDES